MVDCMGPLGRAVKNCGGDGLTRLQPAELLQGGPGLAGTGRPEAEAKQLLDPVGVDAEVQEIGAPRAADIFPAPEVDRSARVHPQAGSPPGPGGSRCGQEGSGCQGRARISGEG